MIKKINPFLVIILSAFLLIFLWFKEGYILAAAESGMPFYDIQRSVDQHKYTWSDRGLGNANGLIVSAYPTFLVLEYLERFGVPNYVVEAGLLWFLFISAGIGIYFLTREFFPKLNTAFLLVGVYYYWFNPLSLVNIWHRFLINYMFLFALLPIAIYFFVHGVKKQSNIYSVLFVLATTVYSFVFTSITFFLLLWITIALFGVLFFILGDREQKIFILKFFLLCAFGFLIVNLWWIIPVYLTSRTSNLEESVSQFYTTTGNLNSLIALSRTLGSISDLIRFLHIYTYEGGQPWAKIFLTTPLVIIEFIISGIIVWFILVRRKSKPVLILGAIFFTAMFLMKGNNPPFGELFQFAFLRSFPLQLFRNPFEKFGFLLLISSPILLAGTCKELFSRLHKRSSRILFPPLIFILVLVFFGFPFWTKSLFQNRLSKDLPQIVSYEVDVPSYYKEVDKWLSEIEGNFRFVSLPIGPEGLIYTWDHTYRGLDPSYIIFSTSNISNNTVIPYYFDFVTELQKNQLSEKALSFFRFANVRFIVLRKDLDFKASKMADPKSLEKRLGIWEEKGLVTKRFEAGQLDVYEVDDVYKWPKIYTTNNFFYTNTYDVTLFEEFSKNNWFAVFSSSLYSSKYNELGGQNLITPESIFLLDERWDHSFLSDQELISKLFYVRHLPGETLYAFVRIKEFLETPSVTDPEGRLIFNLGILGKRAVETYKLKKNSSNQELVRKAEVEYLSEFERQKEEYEKYLERPDLSFLIKDSLIYHAELLRRIDAVEAFNNIRELLVTWDVWPVYEVGKKYGYLVYRYKVPRSGRYLLTIDKRPADSNWFLNGAKILVDPLDSESSTFSMVLEKGINEVAVPFESQVVFQKVIEMESFEVGEQNTREHAVDIPDIPTRYRIDFDFRFISGNVFHLAFFQNIDQLDGVYSVLVDKQPYYHGWRHFSREFTTDTGADEGILKFLNMYREVCSYFLSYNLGCEKHKNEFNTEIRNFSLTKISYPRGYLASEEKSDVRTTTKVEFNRVDKSLYEVRVDKPSDDKEVLVFAEMFNPYWKATYDDGSQIPDSKHLLVNFYANGWILDRPGTYTVMLGFSQERVLEIAKKISLVSLFVLTVVSIYILLRRNAKDN